MAKLVDLDGLAYFYSKIKAMLADKLGKNDVATVATSGSYNDLSDKPTIPSAYTLPTASSTVLGGVKVGNNISVSDGTISLNKSNVTSALGYTPPTSDTVYDNATTTTAGLMSASDKVKLNNIAYNANNYIHPSTHPASMITGLADVATSGSYNDLTDKPTIPAASTVDSELSSTSTNPVQNKVITEAIANIGGGGGVSTDTANTWTAAQTFNVFGMECEFFLNATTITPTMSMMVIAVDSNAITLDLSKLVAQTTSSLQFEYIFTPKTSFGVTLKIIGVDLVITLCEWSDIAINGVGIVLVGKIIKNDDDGVVAVINAQKIIDIQETTPP